jgi:uncharacterized delta-60 repeat protein
MKRIKVKYGILSIIFVMLLLFSCGGDDSSSGLPSGSLDTTFAGSGKVNAPYINGQDYIQALGIQSEGAIVAAGYTYSSTRFNIALARYRSNGALDTTFGSNGKEVSSFGINNSKAYALVIQTDDKIVVAGEYGDESSSTFALARYSSEGIIDTTFGTDGGVSTTIGTFASVYALALQSDGKIVAAGYTYDGSNNNFALARYNTDGTLDTTFGTDGIVVTAGSGDDSAKALGIQSDGKIVAAGYTEVGGNKCFAVVRYNADGSRDTTFGTDGGVITAIGSSDDEINALRIQSNGYIIVAGESKNSSNYDIALARYNSKGVLDTTFGTGGIVITAIGSGDDKAYALGILSDGSIVTAGYSVSGGKANFALLRYNSGGSLITGFGTGGKVTTAIGSGNSWAHALAVQSNGRPVVAGWYDNGVVDNYFVLARYMP